MKENKECVFAKRVKRREMEQKIEEKREGARYKREKAKVWPLTHCV